MKLYAEIRKVEENDDGTLTVSGIASSGARDDVGEIILPEAMREALPDYMKFANIREMHDAKAAGVALSANVDEDGFTLIETQIVDPVAITKVKAKVYKGFSVGGRVLARDPNDRSIITRIRLSEISLVDRPANPDAMIDLWKAAEIEPEGQDMTYSPTNEEVKAEAEAMAKAAGKPGKHTDFVVKARAKLIDEHQPEAEAEAAPPAEDVAKAADAEPVTEAAAEAEPETAEKAADAEAISEPEAAAPDLADALTAAVEKAASAAAPEPEPQAAAAQVTPGLAEFAKGLAELAAVPSIAEHPLAKGLYTVAALAQVLDQLAGIQASTAWEAEYEGDNSTLPAELAASVASLGANLVAMASEEVAELIADMKDGEGEVVIVIDDDDFAYAAAVVDLVKADEALMEKAGARHSKKDMAAIQAMHDKSSELGAKCSGAEKAAGEGDDLTKALDEKARLEGVVAKAIPAIEALTKTLEDTKAEGVEMKKRLEALEAQPMPPKTAGSVHAVSKAQDARPLSESPSGEMTEDDATKFLAGLTEQERGHLLMKVALRNPVEITR